jgi:hypothetical protein
VKTLSQWLLLALPGAGLVGGCEVLAGIEDITYGQADASLGVTPASDQASSGSPQGGDDGSQQTGSFQQSGSMVDQDVVTAAMSGTSSGASLPEAAVDGTVGVPESGPGMAPEASTSKPVDSSADVLGICVPGPVTGQLPFVVDSEYSPTGIYGTGTAATTSTCTVVRASAAAKGNCHLATYTTTGGSLFAGTFWQNNFNWGTQGGFPIPQGATKVTFFARGAVGGEKVRFIAGYTGTPTPLTPCTDSIRGNLGPMALTATWTAYSMPLTGGYPEGVLGAFGWEASAPDAGVLTVAFYVDDIQYQ